MGGRGTYAKGNNVDFTYKTVGEIEGVKVLEGTGNKHSLPEEAHKSLAYIKLDYKGIFRELRLYDENHILIKEIAYHKDKKLGSGGKPILHYHTYDSNFSRSDAILLSDEDYIKYCKYFKGVK